MNSLVEPGVVEARLCYDSAADAALGTRGFAGQPRMLLFKWDYLTVDLLVCDQVADLCALGLFCWLACAMHAKRKKRLPAGPIGLT